MSISKKVWEDARRMVRSGWDAALAQRSACRQDLTGASQEYACVDGRGGLLASNASHAEC